jgi:hypothetical protein
VREVTAAVLSRPAKQCNFIDWRANKIVYKRYVLARPAKQGKGARAEQGRLLVAGARSPVHGVAVEYTCAACCRFVCCSAIARSLPSLPPQLLTTALRLRCLLAALPPRCAASSLLLRRYASLYFIASIDADDNELITLEMIHLFVEVLDRYFGNVCELDIIFNFHKAYYILDELFIGGNLQETSKKEVLKVCAQQDDMMEETEPGKKKKIST